MSPVARIAGALLLLGALVPVQGEQRSDCPKCDGRGWIACRDHKKSDRGLEERTLFCSVVDGCPACGGSGWVLCPRCQDPRARRELERRAELRQAARRSVQERAETMGRELLAAESEHVRLFWEGGDLKVGGRRKSAHQLLHLYLNRLEGVRTRYCELLGVEPDDFDGKMEVFVWSRRQDQLRCSREIVGSESEWPMLRLGRDPRLSLWLDKRFYDGDRELHQAVVHFAGHLLLNSQVPPEMLARLSAAWIDVGFAHWLEIESFGTSDTFCYQSRSGEDPLSQRDWRRIVADLVRRGDLPAPQELLGAGGADLTREQHALAFGLVDWVLAQDPARFELLARRLRTRLPARDAVRELFGCDLDRFWTDWQAWVRSEYPSR